MAKERIAHRELPLASTTESTSLPVGRPAAALAAGTDCNRSETSAAIALAIGASSASHKSTGAVPPRYLPLLPIACGAAAGIIADRAGIGNCVAWLVMATACFLAWCGVFLIVARATRRLSAGESHQPNPTGDDESSSRTSMTCQTPLTFIGSGLLLASVTGLAGCWHHARWNLFSEREISLYATEQFSPVAVRGIVQGTPVVIPAEAENPFDLFPAEERTDLRLEATAIRDGRRWIPCSGRARVLVQGRLESVHAGQPITLTGT